MYTCHVCRGWGVLWRENGGGGGDGVAGGCGFELEFRIGIFLGRKGGLSRGFTLAFVMQVSLGFGNMLRCKFWEWKLWGREMGDRIERERERFVVVGVST